MRLSRRPELVRGKRGPDSRPSKRMCPALGSDQAAGAADTFVDCSSRIRRLAECLARPRAKLTQVHREDTPDGAGSHVTPKGELLAVPAFEERTRGGGGSNNTTGRPRMPGSDLRAGAPPGGRPRRQGDAGERSGSRPLARTEIWRHARVAASGRPKAVGCGRHWRRPRVYG